MIKYSLITLLSVTLSLLAAVDLDQEIVLPEINIEVEQEGMEMRKLAASRKIIISQSDFDRLGDITAGDILKRFPGLHIQGPAGSNRNVMLCGLDKVFQTVLIDGNRPCGGEADRDFKLDRIPLDVIEKIEVINIPTVDYCSDAIAGVVNIITKGTKKETKAVFDLAPSTNSTRYQAGNGETFLAYQNKNFYLSGSYNRQNRSNLEELSDSQSGVAGKIKEDASVAITTFSGNLTLIDRSQSLLRVNGLFSDYSESRDAVQDVKQRSQGGLNYRDIDTDQRILRRIYDFSADFDHQFNELNRLNAKAGWSRNDDEKKKYMCEEKATGNEFTDEVEIQKNFEGLFALDYTNLHPSLIPLNNTLKTGMKLNSLSRNYDRQVKVYAADSVLSLEDGSFDYTEFQNGLYLREEFYFKPLIVSVGCRSEYAFYDYQIIASRQTAERNYHFFNPSLLINYQLTDNCILKTGASRQIARPSYAAVVPIDKIKTKKNIVERGNADLLPAEALVYNLGIELYKQKDFFSIYGYYKDVDNIIEIENAGTDPVSGYQINQFINVAKAKVWGIDVEYILSLSHLGLTNFTLNGNYSYLGSQIKDRNTGLMRRIADQPANMINSSINYSNRVTGLSFSIGANYSDQKIIWSTIADGVLIDKIVTADYLQFDGSLKYAVTPNYSFYFNVNNILDQKIQVAQGSVTSTETIGTSYVLGFKYTLNLNSKE